MLNRGRGPAVASGGPPRVRRPRTVRSRAGRLGHVAVAAAAARWTWRALRPALGRPSASPPTCTFRPSHQLTQRPRQTEAHHSPSPPPKGIFTETHFQCPLKRTHESSAATRRDFTLLQFGGAGVLLEGLQRCVAEAVARSCQPPARGGRSRISARHQAHARPANWPARTLARFVPGGRGHASALASLRH